MAALTFHACIAIQFAYDLTDAFVRSGFRPRQTWRRLVSKHHQRLFRQYCRQSWLLDATVHRVKAKDTNLSANMKRSGVARGIDFAAIEASAEACEDIDAFAVPQKCDKDVLDGRATGPGGGGGASGGMGSAALIECEKYNWNSVENYDDIEVISGEEIDSSFADYLETLPVYTNFSIGKLEEGVSFTITGDILPNCERFSINFIVPNESLDIALHINPRLPQSFIVRNTKVKNVWGREEAASPLPFSLRRGDSFAIQVLVTNGCFMISVNGNHFAEYEHRLPFANITIMEVKGDIENVSMKRAIVMSYPDRLPTATRKIKLVKAVATDVVTQTRVSYASARSTAASAFGVDETDSDGTSIPREWRTIHMTHSAAKLAHACGCPTKDEFGLMLPYYGALPAQALVTGRCLKIVGRVKLLPHSFYINLQKGQQIWPHPVIAFHFNPRFSKHSGAPGTAIVCRNAWYNGEWAAEERSELDTDLLPGKLFHLAIVCAREAFEVYVNHKYITQFRYHFQSDVVDTVYIQGDIRLWDVLLEDNVLTDDVKHMYQNPSYTETETEDGR